MAALVCDICGGKLSMGSGGIAVCESCGMEYTKDRLQEKIQEIKGTVRIDNSHLVDNYLNIARTAYTASNLTEAETYCNKVIEISPNSAEAWLLKGKAAGWQTTLAKPRFSDSIAAFSNALMYAPEEEKAQWEFATIEEIKKLSMAVVSLRGERFKKLVNETECYGFIDDLQMISNTLKKFENVVTNTIRPSEIMGPIAFMISEIVNEAWKGKVIPEYRGDSNDDLSDFTLKIIHCVGLLESVSNFSDGDDDNDIHRYEMIVSLLQASINAFYKDHKFSEFAQVREMEEKGYNDIMQKRKVKIENYNLKIAEIQNKKQAEQIRKREEKDKKEKEEADRRIKDYWEKHMDEKVQLEERIKILSEQISSENTEIQKLQSNEDIRILQYKLQHLEQDKSALGLFKRQEKKAIQEEIDLLTSKLTSLTSKRDGAVQKIKERIIPIESELNEKRAELTKDR